MHIEWCSYTTACDAKWSSTSSYVIISERHQIYGHFQCHGFGSSTRNLDSVHMGTCKCWQPIWPSFYFRHVFVILVKTVDCRPTNIELCYELCYGIAHGNIYSIFVGRQWMQCSRNDYIFPWNMLERSLYKKLRWLYYDFCIKTLQKWHLQNT